VSRPNSSAALLIVRLLLAAKPTTTIAQLWCLITDNSIVIQETVNANDVSRFQQVRQSISNAVLQRPGPSSKATVQRNGLGVTAGLPTTQFAPHLVPYSPGLSPFSQSSVHGTSGAANGRPWSNSFSSSTNSVLFHPSPFYRIETAVSSLRTCESMLSCPRKPLETNVH
jgi:hypothetical protein